MDRLKELQEKFVGKKMWLYRGSNTWQRGIEEVTVKDIIEDKTLKGEVFHYAKVTGFPYSMDCHLEHLYETHSLAHEQSKRDDIELMNIYFEKTKTKEDLVRYLYELCVNQEFPCLNEIHVVKTRIKEFFDIDIDASQKGE